MKHLDVVVAGLVLTGIALAVVLGRAEPEDAPQFGEVALPPELPRLESPRGELVLRGVVRTSAGAPAEEAFVVLLRGEDDPSEAEPLYHAYSDAAGRFAIEGLTPGSFLAVLTHPSAPPRDFPLELAASEEVEWTLADPLPPLPALPTIRRTAVAGQIRLPEALAGGSLAGFEVALVPTAESPLLSGAAERRTTTDARGRFRLEEVVVGPYRVEVLPPWARGGSWPVLARLERAVGADEGELDVPLVVGTIEGELQEADGRPLVGALVRVAAQEARDAVGQPQAWPPLASDAAGRFRIELLPPGTYQLHLRAGLGVRDQSVAVEAGKRTVLPVGRLEQTLPEGQPGG